MARTQVVNTEKSVRVAPLPTIKARPKRQARVTSDSWRGITGCTGGTVDHEQGDPGKNGRTASGTPERSLVRHAKAAGR